jgi:hypothetical protein
MSPLVWRYKLVLVHWGLQLSECLHGNSSEGCRFCVTPRKTWTIEDATGVLNSGYGSFEEYRACANTFLNAGRLDLGEEAIVASLHSLSGRPFDWKLQYSKLVASFLQASLARVDLTSDLRETLQTISNALDDSEEALEKFARLMKADEHLSDFKQLKEMAVRVATASTLIHEGGDKDLIHVASFLRKGFVEWNPALGKRQVNRRETMKLGLKILDGILVQNSDDLTARTLRASLNADLGLMDDADADIAQVLAAGNPSHFALLTAARIDYLSSRGFAAWDKAFPLFQKTHDAAIYGLLVIAYAVAEMEPGYQTPTSEHRLKTMRTFLDDNAGFVSKEKLDWQGRQVLEKNISLNMLIRDEMFGHAFIYLTELEREGWSGSTKNWLAKLAAAATSARRQPRVEAIEINPDFEDVFPDWQDQPKKAER